MITSWLQVWHNVRKWYTLNLNKTQATITTGNKYYTWWEPHHTSNMFTHVYRMTNTGTSKSQIPNKYPEQISKYSWSPYIRNILLLDRVGFKGKCFLRVKIDQFSYVLTSDIIVTSPTTQFQKITFIPRWLI